MPSAVVVGGGLGGLAAAVALQAVGFDATVYEQAPAARREGGSITLWSNGTAALTALGIELTRTQLIARLVMRDAADRELLNLDVAAVARRHGHDCINVWRQDLIADLARSFHGPIQYDRRCVNVVAGAASARARFGDGTSAEGDLLIIADGVHSRARAELWSDHERYTGTTCWEGQARGVWPELPPGSISAIATASTYAMAFSMAGDHVHWFVDTRQRAAAARNPDRGDLERICASWPPPLPEAVRATHDSALYSIPIYVRRPPRRWFSSRTVLLGDAAHGMGPALGQGGTQAFIDALVLQTALSRPISIDAALSDYQRERATAVRRLWIGSNLTLRMRRTGLLGLATRLTPARVKHRSFQRAVAPNRGRRKRA